MANSNTSLIPAEITRPSFRPTGKRQVIHHGQKASKGSSDSVCCFGGDAPDTSCYVSAVLTELEEIDSLLPEWRDLFFQMLEVDRSDELVPPFARPDVIACWAKAARPEMKSIFVVTLRNVENNELCAVFPGFLQKKSIRMLSDSVTDYQDITAGSLEHGMALIREVIRLSEEKIYRLALYKVSDSTLLWECLQLLDESVCRLVKRRHGPCPYQEFRIPRGGDFLSSLSKKRRKNYKAADSRIRKGIPSGQVKYLRGEDITKAVIDDVANLHIANQYRKSGESIFKKQSMRDWLLGLAKVDSGLCLSLFYDGEDLAALNLSFVDIEQRVFYYYIPSFSSKYLHYSLGTWLLVESLKENAPSGGGDFRLDLLCGDEEYKKMWSTERYHVWRMIIFPAAVSNLPMFYFYKGIYALKAMKNRAGNFIEFCK